MGNLREMWVADVGEWLEACCKKEESVRGPR